MLLCSFRTRLGSLCLSRSWNKSRSVDFSRRNFLQYCQGAPLAFLPSGIPFPFFIPSVAPLVPGESAVLRKRPVGFDEFVNEKIHDQIAAIFAEWSAELLRSPQQTSALAKTMAS